VTNHWIPAPRFRGDKFTPAEAGAGKTETYTQSSFPRRRESIAITRTYWEVTIYYLLFFLDIDKSWTIYEYSFMAYITKEMKKD